ncbi:MAG TPA: DUF1365 domain-containing protein [Solirubrobacterales bacterium]|nr:DUF1365 domain-containing protein [Solirubrobacterales bacterium]
MTGSAIYEGWVAHRRAGAVPHSFRYRVFMPLFDLDELPYLLDPIPLWSARRPAPARFRDDDYLPGEGGSLAERARDLVQARLGRRPEGPVRLLANPRYLGVGFNPVSFLFLHDADGALESVVAEVTNTPWGERAAYVLDAHAGRTDGGITARFRKRMHVSPFQPMDQTYEISVTAPGERLGVVIRNLEAGDEVLVASMALHRIELSPGRMLRLLLRYPPMTVAILARIYANALRLKLRGAPFHPHTEVRADEQAVRIPELPRRRRGDRMARGARLRDHDTAGGRSRGHGPRGASAGGRGGDGRPR